MKHAGPLFTSVQLKEDCMHNDSTNDQESVARRLSLIVVGEGLCSSTLLQTLVVLLSSGPRGIRACSYTHDCDRAD